MRKRKVLFLGRPAALAASLLLILAAMTSTVWGADWQAVIKGPDEIPAGELVVLTVETIAPTAFCEPGDKSCNQDDTNDAALQPSEKMQFAWQVLPKDAATGTFRVCDEGRTLVFAARQVGCYHFVLAAGDGNTLQMVTHTLLNVGETPKPVPLPPPEPEPEPQPEPRREFESLAEWAAQKTAPLVASEFFVREKTALAESFTEIAIRIRNGEITTAERARVEMRVLTRKKLDAVSRRSTAAWLAWETELARQLAVLEREGKIDSPEQVRLAFEAIADGLSICEPAPKGGR